jgi:hypothetical protein
MEIPIRAQEEHLNLSGTNKSLNNNRELLNTLVSYPQDTCYSCQPVSRLSVNISFIPALLVALLPKCAFCWVAYMSFFSTLGIGTIPYQPWLLLVMVAVLFVNLGVLLYSAPRRNGYLPFYLALVGALVIVVCKFWLDLNGVMYIGVGMFFMASVWHSLPRQTLDRLSLITSTFTMGIILFKAWFKSLA